MFKKYSKINNNSLINLPINISKEINRQCSLATKHGHEVEYIFLARGVLEILNLNYDDLKIIKNLKINNIPVILTKRLFLTDKNNSDILIRVITTK